MTTVDPFGRTDRLDEAMLETLVERLEERDHADPAKARAYDQALIEAVVTNPRVMRQMPRMLRAVKMELVTPSSYVLAEAGAAMFWSSAIETYQRLIPKSGAVRRSHVG